MGILAAVAVLALLGLAFVFGPRLFGGKGSTRKDGEGRTIVGQSMARARDVECQNNIGQIRLAVQTFMAGSGDSERPASFDDLRLPKSMISCPIGKEPYEFDPSTLRVRCPHPGHEGY